VITVEYRGIEIAYREVQNDWTVQIEGLQEAFRGLSHAKHYIEALYSDAEADTLVEAVMNWRNR